MPLAGYHSSDNGAIHLHLLRALGLKNEKPCKYQWDHLGSDRDHMDEYYAFVTCARPGGEEGACGILLALSMLNRGWC